MLELFLMKNFIRFLIFFPLLLIIGLGYLGFVPYLSNFIGPKPKDLGIRFNEKAYQEAYKKSGIKHKTIAKKTNPKDSLVLIGSHPIRDSFTSEEITALAQKRQWVYWPFAQIQVRFNKDGSAETSGIIKMNKLFNYLATLGISISDTKKLIDKFKISKVEFPFYIKINGTVTNNKVMINISRLELGRIYLPVNYLTQYTPTVNWFLEKNLLANRPGYEIKLMTVIDGKLLFDGQLPDIEVTADK